MTHAWVALTALTALACTEPSYGTTLDDSSASQVSDAGRGSLGAHNEAGTTMLGPRDAAPNTPQMAPDGDVAQPNEPLDAGPASWWTPLAAHENYALRARFFARDRALGNNVAFSHEILFWAKVRVDTASGTVSMEARRCVDRGLVTSSVTLRDDFSWTYAARLPPEQHTLVMRDGTIRSESPTRTIGYEPTQPVECTPGARIAARPGQVWLRDGKCECRSEPLPILATDCRVTDADQDGEPGVAIRHVGFVNTVEGARVKDSCQIVEGVLNADGRMRANYAENYDVLDLTCGNSACSHNDIVSCPRELNTALFEPLPDLAPAGGAWDCEQVVAEAERLLPTELLGFPITGC